MLFGIVIATYRRKNAATPALLMRCIESIMAQSHTDWRVYLIGDHYDDEDEFATLASSLPQEKVVALNLPIALERDDPSLQGEAFWCCAGTNAYNTALVLQRRDEIPVTCHIDDDDYWSPAHLSVLNQAYQSYPEAVFIYTRGQYCTGSRFPDEDLALAYDNLPPRMEGLVHSSASWRLDRIPFSYMNCPKELGEAVPNDAQMWRQVSDFCRGKGLKTLCLPDLTVFHPTERSSIKQNLAGKVGCEITSGSTSPMYHSREAFEKRLATRRAEKVTPLPHHVFYHVSLMPGWEPIVLEQLAMLEHAGLNRCRSHIIATPGPDFHRFLHFARCYSVEVEVLGVSDDFSLGEGPTLNALYSWARDNQKGSVLYFHTKGASNPNCPHKKHWRRAMMRHMISEWEHNLDKLIVDDLIGCAWQPDPNYPHFCGNFWAARCDWLAQLQHPDEYRFGRPDFKWAGTGHSWQRRIYAETWIGSQPYHSVHDRVCIGYPLWSNRVFEVSVAVPGFDYERKFVSETNADDISIRPSSINSQ